MGSQKISKAAVRRAAEQARQDRQARQLPDDLQETLDDYAPVSMPPELYGQVKPVMVEIMQRSRTTGVEKFRKQRTYVAQLAAWSLDVGLPVDIPSMLTVSRIQNFVSSKDRAHLSEKSRGKLEHVLRELARQVHDATGEPPKADPISRPSVKAPYLPDELAAIIRVARTQPTPRRIQQLCAAVGLGLGAGLASTDIKALLIDHIDDQGADGIFVHVPGGRARIVPVRKQYEELVRQGMVGLKPGDPVLGRRTERKNVVGSVVAQAVIPSTCPDISQGRLRSTYLAALIQLQIPLLDMLDAAGLKGVQSLVDIANHLREQEVGR